jgi:type I restriction enzyme, R subunit
MRAERKPLATISIPDYYIRQGEQRHVRPYQKGAMQALDRAIELGKRRFLIELPTGTGKTDLICLYLKRLIQAGRAERILFLVDREQLAKQALEALQDIFGPLWELLAPAPGMVQQKHQITVCLLQTMIDQYSDFSSGYFDVVVADESHRSIYGAWQTALTHFDALHIGLTATPSAYIERNTFDFYQCKEGSPDFSYPINRAFEDEYLVPYRFATGITEIIAAGAEFEEEHYDPAEFEREWTNEKTNRLMMQEFDRLAWEMYKEQAPKQKIGPGKSIVFAITKRHAAPLTQYLNELHPEHKGRYAEVITSDVANADDLIRRFKQEDYPQIAVSVGMLDTGFDCREVLHLVMCRRVRSPILYQQMRGRGSAGYECRYTSSDGRDGGRANVITSISADDTLHRGRSERGESVPPTDSLHTLFRSEEHLGLRHLGTVECGGLHPHPVADGNFWRERVVVRHANSDDIVPEHREGPRCNALQQFELRPAADSGAVRWFGYLGHHSPVVDLDRC